MKAEIERVLRDPAFASEYRVLRQEGEGGMGMVFKAIQTSLNRTVAVKVLLPSLFSDPDVAKRLEREAQLTSDLKKHENIVRLLTFGRVGELPYVVYEFVEGESLAAVIERESPMAIGRAIDLTLQILGGLAHAHKHRIIHRDIKPDNLLLDKFNNVKIMDFGIALDETGSERLTRDGIIIGTPVYMAPEQASGKGVGSQVDLYSAAVILYEMVSGRIPWEQESALGVLAEKVSGRFTPLATHAPALPDSLTRLVDRALDPNPGLRPQGAAAFRRELDLVLSGLSAEIRASVADTVAEKIQSGARPTARVSRPATRPLTRMDGRTSHAPAHTEVVIRWQPPRSLFVVAGLSALLAVVVVLAIRSATVRPAKRAGDAGFESVTARFEKGERVAISWHHDRDAAAVAQVYRSDGTGGVQEAAMRLSPQGRYEARFGSMSPVFNYSYSVLIPGWFGGGEASEPRVLDGVQAVEEQFRKHVQGLPFRDLVTRMVQARRDNVPPAEVAASLEPKLYLLRRKMELLRENVQSAWVEKDFRSLDRWALYRAIVRVADLEWRAQALGIRLDLRADALLPDYFSRAESSLAGAASECRLGTAEGALEEQPLLPGKPVWLSAARCGPLAGSVGQIELAIAGRSPRPFVLEVRVGRVSALLLRSADGGTSSPFFQNFDSLPLREEASPRLSVELKPIDIVNTTDSPPAMRLRSAVLRTR